MYKKICKWCRTEFETDRVNRDYCCEECAYEGRLKWQREYEAKKKKTPGTKRRKKLSGLTETAIAARAAGMTYGEYVAKVLNADSYRVNRKDHGNGTDRKENLS